MKKIRCVYFIFFIFITPYLYAQAIGIDSIDELQLIGNNPSYPRNGNYVLTQDIDASVTSSWNGGKGFQPIGTYSAPFCGVFDGQGYKITGLYINRPDENYVGIFRYVATHIIPHGSSQPPEFYVGKIKNLSIENATIIGGTTVGCIGGSAQRIGSTTQSGYDERHLIENIKIINSKINGISFLGGVVGSISEGTLQNCFVRDIFIIGNSTIGGIVGSSSAKIEKCCSTGLVYGEENQIGGLIGSASSVSYSTINQCFSTCWTFGKDSVGGLIGNNSALTTECYSAGLVYGRSNVGGLVGTGDPLKVQISFFDTDATQQIQSTGGLQLSTDQMLTPDIFQSAGWNYSVWSQNNGVTRPYLNIFPPTAEELTLTTTTENGNANIQPSSPYYLWSVVKLTPNPNTGYRFAGYELYSGTNKAFIVPIETPTVWTMTSSTTLQVKFLLNQSIPIANISDLQKIGNDINYPLFWSYAITSDIDATTTQTWNSGKGFAPIGTNVFWFNGTIDGGGYTISNLYINRPDEQYVALIKYLDTSAKISNLTLSNSSVTGGDNVALLAGENSGNIDNLIISNSQIQSNSGSGGLVSVNKGTINKSSVENNSRVICLTDYAGGICSRNESGATIYFSNVDANVSGNSYIGGITGNNKGTIRKCSSSGTVNSSVSFVGGVAGTNQG
ncbi:MAG: hypothetical protein N2169_07595, partial [bacterium]|nr:hypothetical protein [bacterium]